MMLFFTNLFDKVKAGLALVIGGLIAFLGYKYLQQKDKIEELQEDNEQANAEKNIATKIGELNVLKKQEDTAQKTADKSSTDFESSKRKLDELRKHRPE